MESLIKIGGVEVGQLVEWTCIVSFFWSHLKYQLLSPKSSPQYLHLTNVKLISLSVLNDKLKKKWSAISVPLIVSEMDHVSLKYYK